MAGPHDPHAPASSLDRAGAVFHPGDPLPPELAPLAAGLRDLRDQRDQRAEAAPAPVVSLVAFAGDDETRRALAKRRHDVKAALRTLGFTVKALETGYRFDDDKAKAKIDAIAKAVQVLERESELLADVLAEGRA